MEQNVGGIDRIVRIAIGVLSVAAGLAALAGLWEIGVVVAGVAILVGIVLLATGTTQKCPINEAAGIDTTEQDGR